MNDTSPGSYKQVLRKQVNERRTDEQLREHYEVERELAQQLRTAMPQERSRLYSDVYKELFRRVPHHPRLTRKTSPKETQQTVNAQLRLLQPFLKPSTIFVEIGPGDCALAYAVASQVKRVYAVDVSAEIAQSGTPPPDNFELILTNGRDIPLPKESADLVYSYQLMEHLHPDDALPQLRSIHRTLLPGGTYICVTPNPLNGPWDISRHFDRVATGFHLHEYSAMELQRIFAEAGFADMYAIFPVSGRYVRLPTLGILRWYEAFLGRLPYSARYALASKTLPTSTYLVAHKVKAI